MEGLILLLAFFLECELSLLIIVLVLSSTPVFTTLEDVSVVSLTDMRICLWFLETGWIVDGDLDGL